jgi:hypothetical protein
MRDRLSCILAAVLACAGLACAGPADPPAAATADLILTNAAVYTVDGARSWAEAVAIGGGRIAYVGPAAGAMALAGDATRVVDLAGDMLLPGFQDAHVHPVDAGVAEAQCPLFDLESAEAVGQKVARCAQADPGTGWIVGSGWTVDLFVPSGIPDKKLLDAVAPDRPVALYSTDGHSLWVNSKALAIAGITAQTSDPPRGRIDRYPGGSEPAGGLQEEAMELVAKHLPPLTDAILAEGLRSAARTLNGFGITAIQDAMVRLDGADAYTGFGAYHTLDDADELPLRVVAAMYWDPEAEIDAQVARFEAARTAHTRGRVRATSIKIFQDGVLETGTAALLEPYLDAAPGFRGELLNAQPRLDEAATRLDALGFQLHFHAIGDAAIRSCLDAVEAARRANGSRDARHHVSHLELLDPADIPRFRSLGVVANFQPLWAYADAYITDLTLPRIGAARGRWLYPMGSFRAAGVPIAFGSDWSVSSPNPLLGIETAVTRQSAVGGAVVAGGVGEPFLPQERLTLADAIAAYTIAPAFVNFLERDTGSIEVGKLADLVVLDRNLFAIPAADISEVRVVATLLEGKLVHGALP